MLEISQQHFPHKLLVEIVKTSCLWLGQPISAAYVQAPANYESVAAPID